jgi:hypothetical protein
LEKVQQSYCNGRNWEYIGTSTKASTIKELPATIFKHLITTRLMARITREFPLGDDDVLSSARLEVRWAAVSINIDIMK